jgi:hypothetical protein
MPVASKMSSDAWMRQRPLACSMAWAMWRLALRKTERPVYKGGIADVSNLSILSVRRSRWARLGVGGPDGQDAFTAGARQLSPICPGDAKPD